MSTTGLRDPDYEEVDIPVELRKWDPSLRNLQGPLLPGQEECNYFSSEMGNGRRKKPRAAAIATSGIRKRPRVPEKEARARCVDSWGKQAKITIKTFVA